MEHDVKVTEKNKVLCWWFWLAISGAAFLIFTAPHLWSVLGGKAAINWDLVASHIFWACVFYVTIMSLRNADFEGRCCYCKKGVYSGQHRMIFDWEEETVRSLTSIGLKKVAHFSCYQNTPEEKRFDFLLPKKR